MTSLKVRSKVKDTQRSHSGFRALKRSGSKSIREDADVSESVFVDDAEYEHYDGHYDASMDDIYSGERLHYEKIRKKGGIPDISLNSKGITICNGMGAFLF